MARRYSLRILVRAETSAPPRQPSVVRLVAAVAVLAGPWMLRIIVDYTRALILSIPAWVN